MMTHSLKSLSVPVMTSDLSSCVMGHGVHSEPPSPPVQNRLDTNKQEYFHYTEPFSCKVTGHKRHDAKTQTAALLSV